MVPEAMEMLAYRQQEHNETVARYVPGRRVYSCQGLFTPQGPFKTEETRLSTALTALEPVC